MSDPAAEPLSAGQQQAIESIRAIARRSRGALTVDAIPQQPSYGVLEMRIWLSAASLPHAGPGLQLRPWEPIDISIPEDFPDSPPVAAAGHADFDDLPHVAHGSGFCIRISPNNWHPGFGMNGFLQEVIATYRHISLGTLQGNLLPWHPPPADPRVVCVVVQADLPPSQRATANSLVRWAGAVTVSPDRVDVIDWLDFPKDTAQDEEQLTKELSSALTQLQHKDDRAFLVPALVLPRATAFEYSYYLAALLDLAGDTRIANRYLTNIGQINRINRELLSQEENRDNLPPGILLLRAPADTTLSSSDVAAHFAAGILAPDDAQLAESLLDEDIDDATWRQMSANLLDSDVFWAQVYDNRAEVRMRRADGRPTGKLAEAKVVVLGCGALGAQIAEHCVRAGVDQLHLIDSADVNPGILVRQPYEDTDIGQPKAEALAGRLSRIRPAVAVTASVADVLSLDLPGGEELGSPDLIIDATASRAVATKIERSRRGAQDAWPTLVTVGISQRATAGIAAVTPRGFAGSGVDLLRKLGLEASRDQELADIHDAFFPLPANRTLFHPEPGCSDATFIGSATDVGALAAQLLDSALSRMESGPALAAGTAPDPVTGSLCITRLGHDDSRKPARVVLSIAPDGLLDDRRSGYQVRLDPRAQQQMMGIAAAAASAGDAACAWHSGGLLLGQFDDACQIAWVSAVTGPPPGSSASQPGLELNIPQAQEYLAACRARSRGLLSHIGCWHTHLGSAMPSETDRQAMSDLLGHAPRLLLLILGRPAATPGMHAEIFTA